MQRIAILAAAALLLLLVAVQLVLPGLVARRIEDHLTAKGGTAQVDLSAFPSIRLLFREGARIKVRAHGIETPLGELRRNDALNDLDGFDEVDVRTSGSRIGPFEVGLLTLTKHDGEGTYSARIEATVTGGELSAYAGRQLGGGLGGFLGGLAGGAFPGSATEIPIDIRAVLRSDDGRARAVAVSGSVAGIPAGPLVEALASALAGRF